MKINIRTMALTLFIIVFFKPLSVNAVPVLATLNSFWDMARIAVCLFILVRLIKDMTISYTCAYIICFELFCLCVTIFSGGDYKSMLVQSASVIGFSLLTYDGITKNQVQFFECLFKVLSLLVVIQLITMLVFPNGLGYDTVYYNEIYFLASKNGLIKFIYPTMVSGICLFELCKDRRTLKKVNIISLVCVYIAVAMGSTTTMIGIALLLIFYGLYKTKWYRMDLKTQKLILFCVCLIAILGSLWGSSNGFLRLLSVLTDAAKTDNYVSRIVIWKRAMELIKGSPIVGYGMPRGAGHVLINGKYFYAHNGYLEVLLYGGLIGFGIVLATIHRSVFGVKYRMNAVQFCISSAVVGYLVMMITESHIHTISFWAFLVMLDLMKSSGVNEDEGGVNP